MAREYNRTDRVADYLRQELASLIQLQMRDPRVAMVSITDVEALEAFQLSCALEGIIPALEPSHALAHVMKIAPTLPKDHLLVMNMCGRGDKDIFTVAKHLGFDMGA